MVSALRLGELLRRLRSGSASRSRVEQTRYDDAARLEERTQAHYRLDDGREYFFHRDGLESSVSFDWLSGGEKVTFDIEASQKGPRAQRVPLA